MVNRIVILSGVQQSALSIQHSAFSTQPSAWGAWFVRLWLWGWEGHAFSRAV